MTADGWLITAAFAAAAGVAVLRLTWARPRRSMALNTAGWALLLGSAAFGWQAAGAWGSSIAALAGMTAACIALGFAALHAPPAKPQKASSRRAGMLPEGTEPLCLARRLATFVLTVPVAAAVSIALAVALSGAARLAGWSEADSNVSALLVMPLAWTLLSFILLMQRRRRAQIATLLAASLPVWPMLAAGVFW